MRIFRRVPAIDEAAAATVFSEPSPLMVQSSTSRCKTLTSDMYDASEAFAQVQPNDRVQARARRRHMCPLLSSSSRLLSPPWRLCQTLNPTYKVLPPSSFATRLKEYSERKHVFVILGLAGMVVMLGFGVFSWLDPTEAMRLADLVSAFGEALAVGGDKLLCAKIQKLC